MSSQTFVTILRNRAQNQPARLAYRFLVDGEDEEETLTYAEVDRVARAIAADLQARSRMGDRAVLLYPPGLEFISAFIGCLYAGVLAVPAYPDEPSGSFDPLGPMMTDARATLALTTSSMLPSVEQRVRSCVAGRAPRVVPTDLAAAGQEDEWRDRAIRSEDIAYLQYTSGSTDTPRGVVVTHDNLLHNSAALKRLFEHDENSGGVAWLPPYHDMGLVGAILQPLYGGFPATLMSPLDFLLRPARWLEAISRFRATSSGGPNFGYELCVRRAEAEFRFEIDLSSWRVAFNGSEPVAAETIEAFTNAFARFGFQRQAFYPCYGLAESTVIAAGGEVDAPPVVRGFDRAALERGRSRAADANGTRPTRLVGCGRSLPGHRMLIADPVTGMRRGPGEIGEIWISGRSVAAGYWNRPEESTSVFGARLKPSAEGPFLRTGDLGFLHGDELFVVGRATDLIVVRGRNHYPQDIEAAAQRAHPLLRKGCGAAFASEARGTARVVLVQEIKTVPGVDLAAIATAVRREVAETHGLMVDVLAFVRKGAVPKTLTGKIRRRACRAAFAAGALDVLGRYETSDALAEQTDVAPVGPPNQKAVEAYMIGRVAAAAGIPTHAIDRRATFSDWGLDSVRLTSLAAELESWLGRPVSPVEFFDHPTIESAARHFAEEVPATRP